jgi:hypothetical protein
MEMGLVLWILGGHKDQPFVRKLLYQQHYKVNKNDEMCLYNTKFEKGG